MIISTNKIKVPEPKPPVDHQPRDAKGKWDPPTTNKIQPKEQAPLGPRKPSTYMDTHRNVRETALDTPKPKIEPPAKTLAEGAPKGEPGQGFTPKEKSGKGKK
jgi:hypothetical protein